MEMTENNNSEFTDSNINNTNKEAEERQALELKSGLHPLKVFSFFFLC